MFKLMSDLLEWFGFMPVSSLENRAPDAPVPDTTSGTEAPPEGPDAGAILWPDG
jgi:hypothetical protein